MQITQLGRRWFADDDRQFQPVALTGADNVAASSQLCDIHLIPTDDRFGLPIQPVNATPR